MISSTPIYIPSKGRPECPTWHHFTEKALREQVFVVVEPQDNAEYFEKLMKKKGNLVVLPENDRGIAFVRNWVLEDARRNGFDWLWMLDDDITSFNRAEGGKNHKIGGDECLRGAEEALTEHLGAVLAQGALEYAQFAWSYKGGTPYRLNSYCDVAVLINVERTKELQYDPHVVLKEDRDFTLQCLAAGYLTARSSQFSFQAPKNGSNEGGLRDVYQQDGREALASQRMAEKWPGICTPQTKKDGRPDTKINWRHFKPPKF